MKSSLKLTATAIVAAGSLFASTAAFAAACPKTQELADFRLTAAAACTAGDKDYTWLADDLPDTGVAIEIDFFTLPNGKEVHSFGVNPSDPGQFLQGVYNISYTIEITDPLKWFESVSIDADVPSAAPDVDFTKRLFVGGPDGVGTLLATLTSTDGTPSGDFDVSATKPTKFWVYETVTVGANGAVNSYTDTYTQSTGRAPEPGTLALLGLGLAGLAISRRRKQ